MQLTIVIAMFRMAREIPRTLFTLSPTNQQGVASTDYEIVVVDNGSPEPLSAELITAFPSNASYHYVETSSMSPAAAINAAIAKSATPFVGCLIDGARMASPGVISRSLQALEYHPRRFVYSPSFHLGRQLQNDSAVNGYNQQTEDELLASVDWRSNGYLLFEVSNVTATPERLMLPTFESNCFFLSRELWDEIGGYDERFESAGGGLVNWEYFKRAVECDSVETVNLLGEATFHQFHGGASTNQLRNNHPVRGWFREYESIIGQPFRYPKYRPRIDGVLSDYLASVVYGSNSATSVAVARELGAAGLHHEAVEVMNNRSKNDPNNPAALRDLALSLIEAGRFRGALGTIESAIEIAPTQAELYATRAQILRLMGNLSEARASVADAMALDPLQYEAQFELGLIERVAGDPDAAIIAFENAIDLNGELRGDYAMQLVSALSAIGNDQRAQQIAHEWFDLAPRDIRARLDYVDSLVAHEAAGRAAEEADALLSVLPSVVLDRPTRRRVVEILGQFDGVVQRLRAAIPTIDPAQVSASPPIKPTEATGDSDPSFTISVSETFDRFVGSVDRHYRSVADESSRHAHALGGSIREADALALSSLVTEIKPQHIVVIGAYLGLSCAVIANSAPVGASIDAIDPSVRHRIFDDPLGHAEHFLAPWSRTKALTISRLYFGARSIGPAIYDLTHYPPVYDGDEARHLADAPPTARREPGQADLVYVDVGLNDADFVRIARRALDLARPRAPVVFGSTNLPGVIDLLDLIAEASGARTERLRSGTQLIAGRHETILGGEGPLLLRKAVD